MHGEMSLSLGALMPLKKILLDMIEIETMLFLKQMLSMVLV